MRLEHAYVPVNGVRLHVACAGPENGPLVVLLHGFPEFWYGWHHQLLALARAGFRVLAPDGRGYNLSGKPSGTAAYATDRLVEDALGLIRAADRDSAYVVGHDWGGMVAWKLAERHPGRVARLAVLNAPHPAVFARALRENPAQRQRSLYLLFFRLPWLPEVLLRVGAWKGMVRALEGSSRPGTFGSEDLARYREAWSRPGAFTAMLNWYRAAWHPSAARGGRVRVPTLLLWGERDAFLGRELAGPSIALCDEGELVMLEEATHWLHHEEPGWVNARLEAFLRG